MIRSHKTGLVGALAAALLILAFSAPAFATIPQAQHDALMALYNGTNGAGWTINDGWGGALGTEDTWWGVSLNADGSGVLVIMLGANNLSGTLPADIANLPQLTFLDLDGNKIHGEVPSQIGNLTNLARLDLSLNQFTGALPSSLGSLTKLTSLRLNGNAFAGAIPTQLESLTNLTNNTLASPDSGGLDIRYNGLYTTDAGLQSFLDSKQNGGKWSDTQTIAPTGLKVDGSTDTTAELSWNAIEYTGDDGGYKLYMSTTSGGPYNLNQTTTDKLTTSASVMGLTTGTKYFFVVQTFTDAHLPSNSNAITSGYSSELAFTPGGATQLSASASASATSGKAPLVVAFTSTVSGGTSPYNYAWSFGDGGTSTEANPSHTYGTAGNFSVSLSVTDSSSPQQSASDTHLTIAVSPSTTFSVTDSASATSGQAPLAVSFTSSVTAGTAPYTYQWDLGDGSTAATASVSHTYTTGGTFSVTLKVTDSSSPALTANATPISITVVAPCTLSCTATVPTQGIVGQELTFTGQATASSCSGTPSYAWSFGDGGISTEQSPKHTYSSEGTYMWSLGVAIQDQTCPKTGTVTIVTPPTISGLAKQGDPFRITINGINFKTGVKVYINGAEWTNVQMKSTVKLVLKGGSSLKAAVPKNTSTQFKVKNPDGGEATTTWQWP